MKKIFLFLITLLSAKAFTQTPSFPTSGDIYLGIKKLNVLGSVLYLAAHPDDENTRLITYFSKDKLYRTGYLSLTRGDGGQNLIGEEQGIELGLIRTQELLAARRIDGGEQFFSRAFDFGYSKNPEETFTKWDREKILSDVVWVIRKFQPDVIITRFPTTGEGGHGQHTASAILANEAFTAAADPKRFPEQLKYVQPWQAKRILWNAFNFGNAATPTSSDQFRLDAGDYNPVLGKSYGEIAAESRSQHKSQGFGVARSRGEAIEFFKTTGGDAPVNDLLDGVNTTWAKALSGAKLNEVQGLVNNILAKYDFSSPQASVPGLLKLYQTLSNLATKNVWTEQKRKEVKDLIVAASGLWIEAFTNTATVAQGDSLAINVVLNNRLGENIKLQRISGGLLVDDVNKSFDTALQKNKNFVFTQKLFVSPQVPITQPYWLQEKMSEGYYNVSNQEMIGRPDVQPAATVNLTLSMNGETISFDNIPVRYKFNDQVRGELYEPLVVTPPYTVEIAKTFTILGPKETWMQEFTYTAQRSLDSLNIYVDKSPIVKETHLQKSERRSYSSPLAITGSPEMLKNSFAITYRYFEKPESVPAKTMHTIRYDHIPYTTYFTDATTRYVALDVKTEGKKIGYIVGAGDKVADALEQMGYEVTLLTEKELERNNLKHFDAIIAGVRAFNANDWMSRYYDKLMKYVEDGGNYIVQYSQNNNIRSKIGPYNFTVSNKRITDENAAVNFLLPQHPVLNFPNKITQDDFKGWIQERSIYHAENWDSHYEPIFSMADPGEAPNNGSLIITKYGKGFFSYTGLVFFRELPAGVPGAYRLLANLIALNKTKGM